MAACCDPKAYGSVFDERAARRNAVNFRRKGLGSPAAEMVRALAERGLAGATVLEVGAGSGSAQVALLEAGAARGVAFDLSPASEAVAAEYHGYTDEALARNVFGAPSYVIDGEIFWGQDRLEFVERALAG